MKLSSLTSGGQLWSHAIYSGLLESNLPSLRRRVFALSRRQELLIVLNEDTCFLRMPGDYKGYSCYVEAEQCQQLRAGARGMAKYAAGGDDDGEGTTSPRCKRRRLPIFVANSTQENPEPPREDERHTDSEDDQWEEEGDQAQRVSQEGPVSSEPDRNRSTIPVFKVSGEGDLQVVKGNVEKHNVLEGKRRKKTKQVTTPRPACSWVCFSREFIKEYSASHPESSGLKAATKAASETWKSMSLEEKAKFTTRAREVWDNYLSTAPPRTPKPRKQTKLVTRCSPGRLFNVLQHLTAEQKDAVKIMGFGSLLGLRCRTLRRSLCLWLLERFNTMQRSLEICGGHIHLYPKDVELVMGLAASGKDVVNSGPDDLIADLRNNYNATNRGISVRLLEERLSAPEAGDDFKRSFVLYALGTLLSPTARLDVSPSFLHFLTNMSVVHQYNWGKFLLDRLVREISRFRQGKQQAVGGCLLFLQLFYYERISIEGTRDLSSAVSPCLSSWGEDEITEREKQERERGGYGCGQVVFKDRFLGVETSEDRPPACNIINRVEHDPLLLHEANQVDEEGMSGEIIQEENNMPIFLKSKDVVCGDIELIVESVRTPCRNKEYGCNERVDCVRNNDHEGTCMYAPCACPLPGCNFVSSSDQLSLHFSTKHWDSGRRFRYKSEFAVSLKMNEQVLVLQAEDDGALFLLNKGIESIGHTVMLTCIAPSSSKRRFMYDLVLKRGSSSLRLNSLAECFPGRVEGFPQMDFFLVPYRFLDSTGQLNLDVCIRDCEEELSGDYS